MPTYEYRCKGCGDEFEEFQSIKADPLTECTKCGGKVDRLISAGGGLIFKGSGFYSTDYRSEGYKTQAKKESEGGSSKKSESETKGKSEPKKSESD